MGVFAIGWMYGFHGFAPIGTDLKKIRTNRCESVKSVHPSYRKNTHI
ncbi:MAG: hypothetical protein RL329_1728, partial [Bacteroidota bacterium]